MASDRAAMLPFEFRWSFDQEDRSQRTYRHSSTYVPEGDGDAHLVSRCSPHRKEAREGTSSLSELLSISACGASMDLIQAYVVLPTYLPIIKLIVLLVLGICLDLESLGQ